MWRGLPQSKKKEYEAGTPSIEKKIMRRGLPQEKKKIWRGLLQEKKNIWRGLPQLNDDMVGTPTRKRLGFQQVFGVANLISKHERGAKIGITRLITRVSQTV